MGGHWGGTFFIGGPRPPWCPVEPSLVPEPHKVHMPPVQSSLHRFNGATIAINYYLSLFNLFRADWMNIGL